VVVSKTATSDERCDRRSRSTSEHRRIERILPTAITGLVVTEGSTVPINVMHAGLVRVAGFIFNMP
jgi:hypothetical protein